MISSCFGKATRQINICKVHINQATYKVILEENLPPSALIMFSAVGEGPQDQDLNMARSKLQTSTPLKASGMGSREEDYGSQTIKESSAA